MSRHYIKLTLQIWYLLLFGSKAPAAGAGVHCSLGEGVQEGGRQGVARGGQRQGVNGPGRQGVVGNGGLLFGFLAILLGLALLHFGALNRLRKQCELLGTG